MEQFSVNELVLARDGPLLYDAKIRKIADGINMKYYVHYMGWHRRYDTWLSANDLLKYTENNLQLKVQLTSDLNMKKSAGAVKRRNSLPNEIQQKKCKRGTKSLSPLPPFIAMLKPVSVVCSKLDAPNNHDTQPVRISIKKVVADPLELSGNIDCENPIATEGNLESPNGKDVRTDGHREIEKGHWSPRVTGISPLTIFSSSISVYEEPTNYMAFGSSDMETPVECEKQCKQSKNEDEMIPLPNVLQKFIKDDFEILESKQKIHFLPANPSIEQLLSEYLDEKTRLRLGADTSDIQEFVKGIIEYFNELLGKALIYTCEKKKHIQVKKNNKNMPCSKIYGTVHLLRLISKIGPFIHEAIDDEKAKKLLVSHFVDLLSYIQDNAFKFLTEDIYVNMS